MLFVLDPSQTEKTASWHRRIHSYAHAHTYIYIYTSQFLRLYAVCWYLDLVTFIIVSGLSLPLVWSVSSVIYPRTWFLLLRNIRRTGYSCTSCTRLNFSHGSTMTFPPTEAYVDASLNPLRASVTPNPKMKFQN